MTRDLGWELDREVALRVLCAYCKRGPGQPCRDPRHGEELHSQAAHAQRILAGHARVTDPEREPIQTEIGDDA